jgi:hopene-associated glycosyltransferase HpnB
MLLMLALAAFCVWVYLLLGHGRFWSSQPQLPPSVPSVCPDVDIVVPARDEAQTIGPVIASLLAQDYPGTFRIILVDDDSTDGTADRAGVAPNLQVIRARCKPAGWSGKLWAVRQGVAAGSAPLILFTDADIVHDARHLSALAARLQDPRLQLVSEMVRLNCTSLAERVLVPAFVYFFQMLYPFRRVNDPRSRIAAAAGGTILIRREALELSGGIDAIKDALIDDVSLARRVKIRGAGGIYLGHSALARSIRPYPRFSDIWRMIARTAFTQLRYSAVLLVFTILALTLVWLVPVWSVILGGRWERALGALALALAAASYLPTLKRYGRRPIWALALPLIAFFYMAATIGSALDHWRGAGARWKNRSYGSA